MAEVFTPAGEGLVPVEPDAPDPVDPVPKPEPDEPDGGIVPRELPDNGSTACSTTAPTTPDAATRTTAAIAAIPQFPTLCLRGGA